MQLLLYYVLWPFAGGIGTFYLGLVNREHFHYYLVGWVVVWSLPLSFTFKRHLQYMQRVLGQRSPSLLLVVAIPLLMYTSLCLGLAVAPTVSSRFLGVDVNLRLQEVQADVGRETSLH
jgi:hypothetical protein